MAEKFFKGFNREQILRPVRSREATTENTGEPQRAERLSRALEKVRQGTDNLADVQVAKESEQEVELAVADAGESFLGGGTPEDQKGSLRKLAYNTIAAKSSMAGLSNFSRDYIESKTDDLSDLTDEKLKVLHQEAREKYFEENGINDKPYLSEALEYSRQYSPAIIDSISKKRNSLRQLKADALVRDEVMSDFSSFEGTPQDFEDAYESNKAIYKLTIGDGTKVDELAFTGILQAAMQGNEDAAKYVNSKNARSKFGYIEGFDKSLQIASKQIKKNRAAILDKVQNNDRERIFGDALADIWTSESDMKRAVNNTSLDNKEKFSLIDRFKKKMKTEKDSLDVVKKLREGNKGPLLASKPKVRDAAFTEITSIEVSDLSPDIIADPQFQEEGNKQLQALMKWSRLSAPLPDTISESLNAVNNNGDITTLTNLSTVMEKVSLQSPKVVDDFFKPETQAKLRAFNIMRNDERFRNSDGSTNYKEIGKSLDTFDETLRKNTSGFSERSKFIRELTQTSNSIQKSLIEKFKDFGEDRSFFQLDDAISADYSVDRMSDLYIINRSSGLDEDKSLENAKKMYKNTHDTVELHSGNSVDFPRDWIVSENMDDLIEHLVREEGAQEIAGELLGKEVLSPTEIDIVPSKDFTVSKAFRFRASNGLLFGPKINKDKLVKAKNSLDNSKSIKGSKEGELNRKHRKFLIDNKKHIENKRREFQREMFGLLKL